MYSVVRLYRTFAWVAGRGGRGALGAETETGQGQLEGLCLNARLGLYLGVHREPQVSQDTSSFRWRKASIWRRTEVRETGKK